MKNLMNPRRTRAGGGAAAACMAMAFATIAVHAHEPGAHVHGVAQLRVVLEGPELEVTLESPLDNMLGFEHAPRTEAERAAVRAMAAKLRRFADSLAPTPEAHCVAGAVHLASSALPANLLGQPAPAAVAPDADGHADLDADFTWHCANPSALRSLEAGLLKAFPGIRQLKVQVAEPHGQHALVLTATQRTASW